MTSIVHDAQFVFEGLAEPEEVAERLRDEFPQTLLSDCYQMSRRQIAVADNTVAIAIRLREDLPAGTSAHAEAWSQQRADEALGFLVEKLATCPTWHDAHQSGRVSGRLDARPGGSAEYQP
ncbi:MAG: hypothetical protein WKF65_08495 [Gaiellaceae bacterium]